jgi:DNA end-binding protein Ku
MISFGMVSIPIKLYGATASKSISFHLLHEECGSRIQNVRWCPVCERAVEYDELAKGYEYRKNEHVVMHDEDWDKLPLPSKSTITLLAFVKSEEIDPVYFEKSYYLEPDERGTKAFALLTRALSERHLNGIAKIAIRTKERLCTLRTSNGTLMLDTLYYPDEIQIDLASKLPEVEISDQEIAIANTLIDLLAKPFEPQAYQDEYRTALMQLIDAKLEGQEVVTQPAVGEGKVIDLMEALRASVQAAREEKESAKKKRAA